LCEKVVREAAFFRPRAAKPSENGARRNKIGKKLKKIRFFLRKALFKVVFLLYNRSRLIEPFSERI
jgi:hypothetical protein